MLCHYGVSRFDLCKSRKFSHTGRRVREVFALLHPLASRPPVYSPNKKFGFDLGPTHLQAIEAVDTGKTLFSVLQ